MPSLNDAQPSTNVLPSPIAVIGAAGKMATALITGLQSAPTVPHIIASSPGLETMAHLQLPSSQKIEDNIAAAREAQVVLLCVKPNMANAVLSEITPTLAARSNPPVILSVVGGMSTCALRAAISDTAPVARAMPNVGAARRASCTALAADPAAAEHAEAVMSSVGTVVHLPERLFAPATALAGSGVAYVFMMAEALADAGVAHGLPRQEAMRMAAAVVHGAGELLLDGKHAAVLRNDVESPGGTTIAATAALERAGLRAAISDAVDAAVERNNEMEKEAASASK